MIDRLESNRRALDALPKVRRWSSPAIYELEKALLSALDRYADGDVLDAGCGSMPYRERILERASGYAGLDIEQRTAGVQYVCSVTDMAPVPSAMYDTVLCSEVLEHVAQPAAALSEIQRVLKSGGRLVLSVPFLGRLHEEPHDYYRFTRHALATLVKDASMEVESITPTGSVGAFLGHQVSTVLIGSTWHIPLLKWVAFAVNATFVVLPSLLLDRFLGPLRNKLPLGYIVVARKL